MRSRTHVPRFIAGAACAFAVAFAGIARASDEAIVVPAGSHLRFHVDAELSSARSHAGDRFSITVIDAVLVDGRPAIPSGAKGEGTLLVAGHAGTSGHEGDLTLRIDSVAAANGGRVVLNDESVRRNGTNKKAASMVLGFIPYVGMAARFIRGNDIVLRPTDVVDLILVRDAAEGESNAVAVPKPSPS